MKSTKVDGHQEAEHSGMYLFSESEITQIKEEEANLDVGAIQTTNGDGREGRTNRINGDVATYSGQGSQAAPESCPTSGSDQPGARVAEENKTRCSKSQSEMK